MRSKHGNRFFLSLQTVLRERGDKEEQGVSVLHGIMMDYHYWHGESLFFQPVHLPDFPSILFLSPHSHNDRV